VTKSEIAGIAPFFIVRDVPAALAFYCDRLGFDVTFRGPEPDDIFLASCSAVARRSCSRRSASSQP
jgi:catechol 2,3-dioxygenase-like lactoylglutathione lyase family enzyme